MVPLPPARLPAEALDAICQASGIASDPRVNAVSRRVGTALWRVETDVGVWRVFYRNGSWSAKRQPPMREIGIDEIKAEEFAALERVVASEKPLQVISVHRRTGRGARALRVVTDAGVWRVAHTRWGWTAKEEDDFF